MALCMGDLVRKVLGLITGSPTHRIVKLKIKSETINKQLLDEDEQTIVICSGEQTIIC